MNGKKATSVVPHYAQTSPNVEIIKKLAYIPVELNALRNAPNRKRDGNMSNTLFHAHGWKSDCARVGRTARQRQNWHSHASDWATLGSRLFIFTLFFPHFTQPPTPRSSMCVMVYGKLMFRVDDARTERRWYRFCATFPVDKPGGGTHTLFPLAVRKLPMPAVNCVVAIAWLLLLAPARDRERASECDRKTFGHSVEGPIGCLK